MGMPIPCWHSVPEEPGLYLCGETDDPVERYKIRLVFRMVPLFRNSLSDVEGEPVAYFGSDDDPDLFVHVDSEYGWAFFGPIPPVE